jgi:predicted enzyme involved in methoxymalonyl-ACP biosynthesis
MEAKDILVRWLRVRDSYGDLGLICAGVVRQEDARTWVVDDFLMSCRAMGRGVETAFLTDLISQIRLRGGERLVGSYRSTAKNSCVADFYQKHGFASMASEQPGEKRFDLDLRALPFRWPVHIARTGNTET